MLILFYDLYFKNNFINSYYKSYLNVVILWPFWDFCFMFIIIFTSIIFEHSNINDKNILILTDSTLNILIL